MRLNKTFIVVLFILFFMSIVISLTLEEERKLRNQGFEFEKSFKLGEREFSQNDNSKKGFAQVVDDHTFLTRNIKIETNDIIVKTAEKDTHVIFTKGDFSSKYTNYIQIYEENGIKKVIINGKEIKVKKAREKPAFVVDDSGELKEGTIFKSVKDNYNLNGYSIDLLEDSEIQYLEDRIIASVPTGTFIDPSVEDVNKVKGILQVKTQGIGYLETKGGKLWMLLKGVEFGETNIFYAVDNIKGNKKFVSYIEDQVGMFYDQQFNEEFTFVNIRAGTDNPKMYLVFDNDPVLKEPYVLVTQKRIGSVSYNGEGAIITILRGNRIGAGSNANGGNDLEIGKKSLSFYAKNGYAVLIKNSEGKIPTLLISGESFYGPDKKTFYIDGKEIYYKDNPEIQWATHGEGTVALQTIFMDKQGNRLKDVDYFSTNENNYVLVPAGKLKGDLEYYVGEKGTVVSSNLAFNQLTPRARKTFSELAEEEQTQLTQNLQQQGGIAALEVQLANIEEKRSPFKASVSLGGCTGTIVGYKGNKAYVITAAHCVRGVGKREDVWLNSLNKKSGSPGGGPYLPGRVVAVSNADVALVEIPLTDDVRQRGYIKIPSNPGYAQTGDKVLRIGCTTGNVACTVRSVSNRIGENSITTSSRPSPIPGDSGGGLFKGKYIVGVTQQYAGRWSSWGGYGNLRSIHRLLDKNEYSFLYKIIFIFMENSYLMILLLLLHNNKK
ncbi:trypsin-like peptidase domain-containing protein [Candidatus Pacearchaeota archaeon]|nr:trypsin-like peptidase domain-containing protein [Candidatus Pacearchaeota archaeon]